MIPQALMVEKLREAVRVRRSPEFLIIARTNGVRSSGMDDALRRAEAYAQAGADAIYISPRSAEEMRYIGERLPAPLMTSLHGESYREVGSSLEEIGKTGFRILTVTTTQLAFHRAMQQTFRAVIEGAPNPVMNGVSRKTEQAALHETLGFDELIAIEKRTV
jgi:methylisocitrate lyase